jgi:GTP-dependent phosphoenolpyruvate carboxykinase
MATKFYCISEHMFLQTVQWPPNSTVYQSTCSYRQYNGHQILLYIKTHVLTDSTMATKFYCLSEHMFLQTVQWPPNSTVYQNTCSYRQYNGHQILLYIRTHVLTDSTMATKFYCISEHMFLFRFVITCKLLKLSSKFNIYITVEIGKNLRASESS